jgi:hypothetical protein
MATTIFLYLPDGEIRVFEDAEDVKLAKVNIAFTAEGKQHITNLPYKVAFNRPNDITDETG